MIYERHGFFFFLTSLWEYNCFTILLVSVVQQSESAICIHMSPYPLPRASLPSSLSNSSQSSQSTEPITLCYASASHQPTILHSVVCMSMLLSLRPSIALPPHVIKSILYVYLFIPALQLGSSVPFFFLRFHMYVLAYDICFSLSDLLHSV